MNLSRCPSAGDVVLSKMPPWKEARVVDSEQFKDASNLIPPFESGDFFVEYLEGKWKGQLVRLNIKHEGKIWTRITGGK